MTEETFLATATTRGATALDKAEAIEILGDEHYVEAGSLLKHIKSFKVLIMESTGPIVKAAHEAHKAAKTQQNDFLKPIDKAADILGRKMGDYQAELERQRLLTEQIEQERLDAEVKAEAAEFAELIVDEDVERAVAMTENAQAPVVRTPSIAPKVKDTQVRTKWCFEVIDASQLPPQYLMPDEKAIGAIVRAQKDRTSIPGVRVWGETKVH